MMKNREILKFSSVIGDQILISATSFLTTVVFARILPPESYANYVLLLSVTMLVLGFQRSLLTQPFAITLNDYGQAEQKIYEDNIIYQKLIFSLLLVFLVPLFFIFITSADVEQPLYYLLYATGFSSFFFIRDLFLSLRKTKSNLLYGTTSSLALLLLLAVFYFFKVENLNLFLVLSSTVYLGALLFFLKDRNLSYHKIQLSTVKKFFFINWKVGKWLAGSSLLFHISSQIYPWLLLFLSTKEEIAILGVLTSTSNLINPIMAALNSYLLPVFSRIRKDLAKLHQTILNWLPVFAGLAMLLIIVGSYLGEYIVQFFFGMKYSNLGLIVVLPFINQAITSFFQPYKIALNAAKRTDINFWLLIFRSSLAVCLGSFLILKFGLIGVFYAQITENLIGSSIQVQLFRQFSGKKVSWNFKILP